MAGKHYIVPTLPLERVTAVNFGATNADRFSDVDVGKTAKLVGESRYNLTAAGDAIEGFITSVETATSAGFNVGGIVDSGKINVTADGIQADGTGVIAVGDLVVSGAQTARGTAMPGFPKVRKATSQSPALFNWRVVSLGFVGTGAIGTQIVIARV